MYRRRQQALEIKQSAGFDNLDTNVKTLIAQLCTGNREIRQLMKSEHAKTRNETRSVVSKEGKQTRDHVTDQIQNLKLQNAGQEQQKEFLASLRYNEINQRYSNVREAHDETFKWVFDEEMQHRWDPFSSWLRSGDGIYWISGKAGSGKSTFMKFLCENAETQRFLEQWTRPKPLMLTFFFWISGTSIQRDAKGLFSSLLLQLLQKAEDGSVCGLLASQFPAPKRSISDWSIGELENSLRLAIERIKRPLCIFLDGLDEFDQTEGPHTIISLVEELRRPKKIKLVVSSRPEPAFLASFEKHAKLRLQDLTGTDVYAFAKAELKKGTIFNRNEYFVDDLASTITYKADGVFLWVVLAIKSIHRGLSAQDDEQELRRRLDRLPRDMTSLYHDMWRRLNEDEYLYRQDAAKFFRLVLAPGGVIFPMIWSGSVLDIMIAISGDVQETYLEKEEELSDSELVARCGRTLGMVRARCAGLLEINRRIPVSREPSVNLYEFSRMRIEFIHRSAKDFLQETVPGQEILSHYSSNWFEFRTTSIRVCLVRMLHECTKLDMGWIEKLQDSYDSSSDSKSQEKYLDCIPLVERVSRRIPLLRTENILHTGQEFIGVAASLGWLLGVQLAITSQESAIEIKSEFWDYLLLCAMSGVNAVLWGDHREPNTK
jgi:hypothetical protein